MSVELEVYFKSSTLPTPAQWTQALNSHGFEISIDSSVNLRTQSGFMVLHHKGQRTGFEFDIKPIDKGTCDSPEIQEAIATLDSVAFFRFCREDELAIAMPAAIVLARITCGVFYDPQEDNLTVGIVDLDTQIESCKPDYWMVQDPEIRPIPGARKLTAAGLKEAKDKIGSLVRSIEIKPLPLEYETLIVKGVRLLELSVLPIAVAQQISIEGPDANSVGILGRAIRAIDRIRDDLNEPGLSEILCLREFCVYVLLAIQFEPK